MNIYLTGMPGAGKSTIAKLLADAIGFVALDLDSEIEKNAGCAISDIFASQGEKAFRDMESRAVSDAAKGDRRVVATGGGCILRMENVDLMKESGLVVFIDRPLENILSDIETGHRPLLKGGKQRILELHDARIGLYNTRCDVRVDGSGSCGDVMRVIMDMLSEKGLIGGDAAL